MPNKQRFSVFVTRPIYNNGIALLKKQKNISLSVGPDPISRSELKKRVVGVDAILSLLTERIDEEIIHAAGPQLKIIANYATGYDNVDLAAAKKAGVIVTNTPQVSADSVAEFAVALLFSLARRVPEANTFAKHQKYTHWDPMLFVGPLLKNKTVGIVGLGNIGKRAGEMLAGMGMNVIYYDLHKHPDFDKKYKAKKVSLQALLKQSDVVSLHTPLLPSTRHLISTTELRLMKSSALLINTSRGPVVDESALLTALEKKQIAGAALDVFECEPKIGCTAKNSTRFKKLENCILTPHIASATVETREAMADIAARNVLAVLSNKKPLTPVH